jgi:uncharacterized phiE125 gp8 family phage protein
MALVLVTGPTEEPVSTAEAKAHLRVDGSDDDSYIAALITTARMHVEAILRRALITQTWKLVLDSWPDEVLKLPKPPLASVSSVTYLDENGESQTFSPDDYIVDTASEPGRLTLAKDASWPSEELYPLGAVNIQYVAGYADADAVPQAYKQAMLLLIGHFYENREAVVAAQGANVQELPMAVMSLLMPTRVLTF